MKDLNDIQKIAATESGFASIQNMNISWIPSNLGKYLAKNFDWKRTELWIHNDTLPINDENVHLVLDIPCRDKIVKESTGKEW